MRSLRAQRGATARPDDPVTVYGLFSGASGLGQAVRLLADNLEAVGRTVHRVDATPHLLGTATPMNGIGQDAGCGPILWHLNPVEAAEIMEALAPPNLAKRPRIGMWLYELSNAPDHWRSYVNLFDTIWSPSDASANAMQVLGVDAKTIPYCHAPMSGVSRSEGHTQSRIFTVLAMADARSSLARKNMDGAVTAFQRAFPATDPTVRLQLKISHLPADASLRDRIASDPQVELIESRLPFQVTLALMADADVLLSLHRGEGYGLTLVEAMQMGVPVIMTDEPSTRALQLAGCSWTTPSRTVPVHDPQGIYRGGVWAEPDLGVAATHLQTLRRRWQTGQLHNGRESRIQAASQTFGSPVRLERLRMALGALPMKKVPQPELRDLSIVKAKAT
ncbi:MAG: glycosyltransferase [Pseudomonadota bacterium]